MGEMYRRIDQRVSRKKLLKEKKKTCRTSIMRLGGKEGEAKDIRVKEEGF